MKPYTSWMLYTRSVNISTHSKYHSHYDSKPWKIMCCVNMLYANNKGECFIEKVQGQNIAIVCLPFQLPGSEPEGSALLITFLSATEFPYTYISLKMFSMQKFLTQDPSFVMDKCSQCLVLLADFFVFPVNTLCIKKLPHHTNLVGNSNIYYMWAGLLLVRLRGIAITWLKPIAKPAFF
jgi:hypothetical protein